MRIQRRGILSFTVFVSWIFFSTLASSATVTRGPYLQTPTYNAVTIRWRTDTSTDSVVAYGTSANNLDKSLTISGSRSEHQVRIEEGLSPKTKYYYSVGSSSETIASGNSYHFTTSPAQGESTPTRIWVIGDSGTANSSATAVYNAYLNYPGADNTDLWLMLGDNAYNDGTDSQYQDAVFDMYPELLRRTPVWATLGNHDGYSADSSSESGPYYNIFSLPRNAEAGGLASGTEAYYSFDYGNIHFICLDSYDTDNSTNGTMLTWMENDIAATDKDWIIAFWHHPPYTKGSHNSDTESALIDMRENALPILESYGVDMVFTGHSHSYERSYLIDGHYGSSSTFNNTHLVDNGDGREDGSGAYAKTESAPNAGAVYTVAGASGKISGGSLNHPAMFTSLNQLGSVILDVNGNRIDAKYLRSDGQVTDYYTLVKGDDTSSPVIALTNAASATQVNVEFSEPLDTISAETSTNYVISGGISVNSANSSNNEVTLSTSNLSQNNTYTLTVNNVEDQSGNVIATNSQTTFEYQNLRTMSFQNSVSPTSTYAGTSDSYIASGAASTNFGSASDIQADGADGSNGELASLLKWDLSAIPQNATITDAHIELTVFGASNGTYNLYEGTQSWTEGSVSWSTILPLDSRGDLVGNFQPSSTGQYTIALNSGGVAMIQSWISEESDSGLLIMSADTTDGVDIRSSEYPTASQRPRLFVTYTNSSSDGIPTAAFSGEVSSLGVEFTDGSTDPDGTITAWNWNFGDGNASSQQNPSHTYNGPGTYNVSLTVTDSDDNTASTSQSLSVTSNTGPITVELQQGQNNYSGAEDTYVAEGSANTNYGNHIEVLADQDDGSRGELIGLLKWDLSSLPNGAMLTSASITLTVFNPTSNIYNIWEMTESWQQNTATWNSTEPETNRGANIGSFTPTSNGTYTVELNNNGVGLIQSWLDDSSNNGITIESASTRNGIDIRSSEYVNPLQRPKLSVTYQ